MDYKAIRHKVKVMTRRTKLYRLLRDELTIQGYWKRKPRGNPIRAKEASDRVKSANTTTI